MWFGLFLIFVAVPLMELALLIKVGNWLGFWPTFGIIILTAVAGTAVLHAQGMKTMQRAMADMQQGATPVQSVVDGSFILLAGVLLVSPGLITDCLGLLLLIPPVRGLVSRWSVQRFLSSANVRTSTYTESTQSWSTGQRGPDERPSKVNERWEANQKRHQPSAGTVIDGDYVRIDEKTITPDQAAGRTPEKPTQRDRTATDTDHRPSRDVPRRPGPDAKT
jgi:UPF0716 protein FxsA